MHNDGLQCILFVIPNWIPRFSPNYVFDSILHVYHFGNPLCTGHLSTLCSILSLFLCLSLSLPRWYSAYAHGYFRRMTCHTASAFTHAHTHNSAIKTVYRATNKTGPQISISQHILPQTTQKCFNYTNKLFAQSRMARHWNSRTMELDYRWQEITVPICVCMCALCACGRNVLRSRGDGLQKSAEREIASDVTQCRACQNKSSHRTKQRETSYPRDSNNSFDLSSFSRKIPSFPFLNW